MNIGTRIVNRVQQQRQLHINESFAQYIKNSIRKACKDNEASGIVPLYLCHQYNLFVRTHRKSGAYSPIGFGMACSKGVRVYIGLMKIDLIPVQKVMEKYFEMPGILIWLTRIA